MRVRQQILAGVCQQTSLVVSIVVVYLFYAVYDLKNVEMLQISIEMVDPAVKFFFFFCNFLYSFTNWYIFLLNFEMCTKQMFSLRLYLLYKFIYYNHAYESNNMMFWSKYQ